MVTIETLGSVHTELLTIALAFADIAKNFFASLMLRFGSHRVLSDSVSDAKKYPFLAMTANVNAIAKSSV